MPINVVGSTSEKMEKRIYTSSFVQNPYLGVYYIESNIEEDFDMKKQFEIEIIPISRCSQEDASMFHVADEFNDPSKIKKHCTS